jgi:4-oxalocrotonate tautomerase
VTILKEQIREAARLAEAVSMPGDFNAMSWLDLALEEDPQFFDDFFDTAWNELSEEERKERAKSIRKVL